MSLLTGHPSMSICDILSPAAHLSASVSYAVESQEEQEVCVCVLSGQQAVDAPTGSLQARLERACFF